LWVDVSDTQPPEMGKVRPGIIVSGTAHNEVLHTVVVVPTSSIPPEIRPLWLAGLRAKAVSPSSPGFGRSARAGSGVPSGS
jgi:hypothetical protein